MGNQRRRKERGAPRQPLSNRSREKPFQVGVREGKETHESGSLCWKKKSIPCNRSYKLKDKNKKKPRIIRTSEKMKSRVESYDPNHSQIKNTFEEIKQIPLKLAASQCCTLIGGGVYFD